MMPTSRHLPLLVLASPVVLTLLLACTERPLAHEPHEQKQELIPAGELMDDSIRFQYAIYYLPSPSEDPRVALPRLLSKEEVELTLVNKVQEVPSKPVVCCHICDEVQKQYAPPDMQSLQHFGRGLTREQAEQLQKSHLAYIMDFAHGKAHVWQGLRTANRIAEALARETGGVLWDEETREVFTPDEWHRRRVETWTGGVPDVSNHITVHAYKSDEYVRAITLGMSKFGLPDVLLDDFSWSLSRTMGHLINLFCQSIAEGAVIERPGEYELDIRKVQNREVREPQIKSLKSNATGIAQLVLKEGIREEGDPENLLIEIDFDRYPGRDVHAKQEEMLASLFGSEDSITPVNHSAELLAASRRARTKLPILRKAFAAGLNPGEFILVKAPFKTPDGGQEWMWVEVTAWEGNNIKGLLKNEPYNIPTLHGGQIVKVNQEDVFDFIRRYPNGMNEGNETGAIIQKMQQKRN